MRVKAQRWLLLKNEEWLWWSTSEKGAHMLRSSYRKLKSLAR